MFLRVVNDNAVKTDDKHFRDVVLGLDVLKKAKGSLKKEDLEKVDELEMKVMKLSMDLLETNNVVVTGVLDDYVLLFELDQVFNGVFYNVEALVREGGQMYLKVEENL